jgi:HK97 family phage portal protein
LRLLGYEIRVTKALPVLSRVSENRGGWHPWSIIREPYTGAWQRNDEWTVDTVLANPTVFACVTLIAQDVGKLRPRLVELEGGIWTETTSPAFSPILRKPNAFQNYIQFKETWVTSKLIRGNTYVLKQRDRRGIVTRLHVLDPSRVKPLVSSDGAVYYELAADNIPGIEEVVTVPADEIIHDRMNCLFHPLVGIAPLYACGLAADMGQKILSSSDSFFANGASPSGILTAPATIPPETAKRLKEHWDSQYTGDNSGKVAVLGDGLKFEPMRMTSVDAQLTEQLEATAEMICTAYHVPPFKIGLGSAPTMANVAAVENQKYYSDCLQAHIESYELLMDDALGIGEATPLDGGKILGVELDLDSLFRMDEGTLMTTLDVGVGAGIISPNEARKRIGLKPVEGGESPMAQQQNYSLAALAKRDAQDDPFATAQGNGSDDDSEEPEDTADEEVIEDEDDTEERALTDALVRKGLRASFRDRLRKVA